MFGVWVKLREVYMLEKIKVYFLKVLEKAANEMRDERLRGGCGGDGLDMLNSFKSNHGGAETFNFDGTYAENGIPK